ncbi:DUF3182 family protein [Coralloluteibacterium thermophilus]|uniref:DUF3182 family protein n=1 Tax=Coralloluteibacterium thermophilum TaxID=2707049 RepID=A0ABV9NSP3_9GAMM
MDEEPVAAPGAGAPCEAVVYALPERPLACEYEMESCRLLARRLASLRGLPYGGEYCAARHAGRRLYAVPTDTLDRRHAQRLGIRGAQDIFGGVVAHGFVGTKAITQPLVDPDAAAPAGWAHGFRARTRLAVLRGFTVFDPDDAREAARRLLACGPLRLKPVHARGGLGQRVVSAPEELDAALGAFRRDDLARDGLVIEENLTGVVTCSVGRVEVGDLVATYCGTQRLTRNNHGQAVYGGTRMRVVRGGFDALLARVRTPALRMAVAQARTYEAAALAEYPGLVLSRSNYDVAQGRDARGNWCSGVLEQSWRLGGATPAEVVALEAFTADPRLDAVDSACVEVYGAADDDLPPDATLLLDADDPRAGRIRKYTTCREANDA